MSGKEAGWIKNQVQNQWVRLGAAGFVLLVLLLAVLGVDAEQPPRLALFMGRFHPLLVHLPIGFLVLGVLLEAFARRPRFRSLAPAIPFVLVLGAVSAIAAAVAGYLLSLDGGYEAGTLEWHQRLGVSVAVLAVLACLLKALTLRGATLLLQRAYTAVLVGTFGLLAAAGHLGGTLTHGADYLTEYMPEPVRYAMALAPGLERSQPFERIEEAVIYTHLVQPILETRCVECHNANKRKGDLQLDAPEEILKGGEGGPVLAAGRAGESELFRRVTLHPSHEDAMPPDGKRPLSIEEIELLRWWIDSGASFEQKVGEAEATPVIQTILNRLGGPAGDRPSGIFALEVPPADSTAIAAVRATGVTILPIATGTPFLQAQSTNVTGTFGDAQVQALAPLAQQLTWLDLGRTQITDAALAALAGFPHLTRLHLEQTAVSDSGLAHLRGLEHLEYLNLYGTRVTDAGLEHLAGLPKLKTLYLWQTEVTEEGAKRLQEQRPYLQVNLGVTLEPVEPAAEAKAVAYEK